ncbi:unnamed protein product [Dibothriocephalus latus]|uniref:Reverse transcriptase domain-containing protein n=1 Tax=Dibothriocephalus latus TaxID=60516 RepID=A0A3P7QDI4_DIBLA|nr:unnamed protein product [Dibothriocephalus latus]
MASIISGFLAEITMQRLESMVLLSIDPMLWVRYVYDTFVVVKEGHFEALHKTITSIIPGIQIPLEKDVKHKLPFLDVLVRPNADGTLQTSIYRQDTYAAVIPNYASNNPFSHKMIAINSLLRRAKTLL